MSKDLKIRLFIATIESILLYGCESWALSKAQEKSLDGTYTRMLRKALNIHWSSQQQSATKSPLVDYNLRDTVIAIQS